MRKLKKNVNNFEKSTQQYLKEIAKCSPLKREEELNLWKKYRYNNDIEARNKIIKSNLKFVAGIAKNYYGRGLSYSDLIAEGNVGLIKAMDRFDIDKGYKTISYSVWWIKQTILEAIDKRNGIEHEELPYDSEEQNFDDDNTTNNTYSEKNNELISYDSDEYEINNSQKEAIQILMRCLNDKEQYVITKYYGLDGNKPQTLDEIGTTLHLTKERIRQIKLKIMNKMRACALNNSITNDIY